MKNIFIKNFKNIMLGILLLGFQACEDRENYDESLPTAISIIESIAVNGVSGEIDNLAGRISFSVPSSVNLTAATLEIDVPSGITTTPANGETIDLTSGLSINVSNGSSAKDYQVSVRVLPDQIAFIGEAATLGEIVEDDIAEAASWAQQTYGDDFIYIPFDQVTTEALSSVNVLFFFYDQVGSSDLPESILSKKNVITRFIVEGGKMLAGGMATGILPAIGRDESGLLTIRGNGEGFINDDTWGIDGGVNLQVDQRSHPIYTFTEPVELLPEGFFGIISGGFKEDHNNLWDAASLLNPGHELGQFAEFERLFGGKVLAVWSGVGDECCPGIIEWMPTDRFLGTIIAIGVGGMEWNMNDGRTNLYAGNIRAIYRNSIDYLKTR